MPVAARRREPEASGAGRLPGALLRRGSLTRSWRRWRSGGGFAAEYKLRILREAEACTRPGEIGALLRREGLYTSHLTYWRKQRDEGALQSLGRPRGRPKPNPLEAENARLRQRAERAEADLEKARRVIEVQGNVSALLGELLEPKGATGSTER